MNERHVTFSDSLTRRFLVSILFHLRDAVYAPVHKAAIVMAKLHELKFEILPRAPCSPDMAPSDYSLFPNLNTILVGTKFCSNTEILLATNAYFETLDESAYREEIQTLPHRWIFGKGLH
ncbi:Mariner Mos1 transposase like protein [Argiope bruennichi]|uniref:Mariner Mos1 transposase like protein n=1 Tax=Argiope bruennichi TaxID=94029 RepID=A0A8T0FY36_ARGBR|nr:Mariner Mos1 transposase like protein [Argiope bruennichi]